ncbi:MAG TPA: dienelactone hydrolase [Microvirga sp.]|nr:dienelactone hydrolase [Microvirga sp.]
MSRGLAWTAAFLFHAIAGAADAAPPEHGVAVRSVTASAPARGQSIEVTVWYPTDAKGSSEMIGESRIFRGTPALRDAPPAEGHFPVVVMAHGGFRAAPYQEAWLAASLATRGYVIAVARPPVLGPKDARKAIQELWLRPADLSAALTAIENDPDLSPRIMVGKAAAVGFFLGATSALALAGVRFEPDRYARSCDQPETSIDCAWFARGGIDLKRTDAAMLSRSHQDERIKAAVAVDPELSTSFAPESLVGIRVPIDVINLGSPGTIPPALDASGLRSFVPTSRYATIPGATSFSAFNPCTPDGPALLRDDVDDDAICRDGNRPREEIHREIAERIADALHRSLSALP